MVTNLQTPLWQPSADRIAVTKLAAFMGEVGRHWGADVPDYAALHRWSVEEPQKFWLSLWEFADVIAAKESGGSGATVLRDAHLMPGASWFPEARLNFAENLLRRRGRAPSIIFRGESGIRHQLSHDELYNLVSRIAQALQALGIGEGDRVAAFLPNLPISVAVMLATASIGAVFSSCSPDFGVTGVVDRFGQIAPRALFAVDGYFYNGNTVDCRGRIGEIAEQLPGLEKVVVCPFAFSAGDAADTAGALNNAVSITDFIAPHDGGDIQFRRLPFDHPLYILFSSGTTGTPKCIIHGAGGTLIQHLKEHLLQCDVRPSDRLFYFTTLGWMMWNWLVSGLAVGATLMLYDGSPFTAAGNVLFDFAADERITHFGTSAKFIDAAKKAGLNPGASHDLTELRAILSTGSPLVAESFDYVYQHIKADVCLSSISGGTDIVACFVGGNPTGPVWRGEIQAPCLAMDMAVFDDDGNPVEGQKGEMVCRKPFPSMPIGFWDDADGSRYHAAYFERFPGVWRHGDFAEITAHGIIIHGRSDAVLNPGGVRIGTAEIYRQVEQIDQIAEAIAVGQDRDGDVRIILFVVLTEGVTLDSEMVAQIKDRVRDGASPRHVPAVVLQVPDIPRTKSGKITELAVHDVILGREVANIEALANPEALDYFRGRVELEG